MSGQYPNTLAQAITNDHELLLLQWPQFDQENYLVAENNISGYKKIAQYINDQGIDEWLNTLQPGVDESSIDQYRNTFLSNVEINKILNAKSLDGIALSHFKKGVNPTYEAAKIDAATFIGCQLKEMTLNSVFAPFAYFGSSKMVDVAINRTVLNGARFIATDLEDLSVSFSDLSNVKLESCTIDKVKFYESDIILNSPSRVFNDTVIENTTIDTCVFEEVEMYKTTFKDGRFYKLRLSGDEDGDHPYWEKMEFENVTFYQTHLDIPISDADNYFYDCNWKLSDIGPSTAPDYGANILGWHFEYCNFNDIRIRNVEWFGKVLNCSFKNVEFSGNLFFSQVEFIGCDFSGSNLDTVFATKEDFVNAVSKSKNNIWVDGTPF